MSGYNKILCSYRLLEKLLHTCVVAGTTPSGGSHMASGTERMVLRRFIGEEQFLHMCISRRPPTVAVPLTPCHFI